MQADDIALLDDLVEADEFASLPRLARRVADPHVPAQPAQHLHQPAAHLAGTHHAVAEVGELDALALGQCQQAAEHVVHHAACVAARRTGPGDARLLEIVQIQMIGADGAGTDEAYAAALEQFPIHPGDRTHKQHLAVAERGPVDGAPMHATDFAVLGKEGFGQGNVFVGKNVHVGLRVRFAYSRPCEQRCGFRPRFGARRLARLLYTVRIARKCLLSRDSDGYAASCVPSSPLPSP